MPKTSFDPLLHGFNFVNGSPLPASYAAAAATGAFFTFGVAASIAAAVGPNVAPLGVCGGMAWTALDFYHYGKERIPGYDNASFPQGVLVPGYRFTPGATHLYDYIWKRQVDSAVANGGGFLLAVTRAPSTSRNYDRAKALLNAGQPVPVALPAASDLLWEGHHVVAFDYQEVAGRREVIIYDCNHVGGPCMLRIHKDDDVEELAAAIDANTKQWVGTSLPSNFPQRWKGFWIADGYQPEIPPANLEDVSLVGAISAPAAVNSQQAFKVGFQIVNDGEFSTPVHSVGLRLNGNLLPSRRLVQGGRLLLTQVFAVEIDVSPQLAGEHTVEPVYFPEGNFPPRSLDRRRKITVGVGLPLGSWLEVGSLYPGLPASPELGALISGPTLVEPFRPRVYKVKSYKLGIKARIQDDLGGGTFSEPMATLKATLDKGTLQNVKPSPGTRDGTLEATYDPISGAGSTLLHVTAVDSSGNSFEKTIAVGCAEEIRIPHLDLNHVIPDLRYDPFRRPLFNPPLVHPVIVPPRA